MSFSGERRTVRYVVIPEEQAGTVPTATDDEVHKRYNEGKSLYMTPEYRRFTFVDINTTEIAKTIAL
jgi:hypothetical protein